MSAAAPNDDLLATVLLCSRLGLPKGASDLQPLNMNEWNDLVRAMVASPVDRPAKLLGRSAAELRESLGLTDGEADRIARLLERGVQAAVELERLSSRGIWAMTRSDDDYPRRLRLRLRDRRPPLFFGAGPASLLQAGGLAVVGSRDIGDDDRAIAERVGRFAHALGLPIVSGGARGVDQAAMAGALECGGCAVGIVADGLERRLRDPAARAAIVDERLVLITPFKPDAAFDVGNAMARNRLIYCLADAAVVVSSGEEKGGTWAGATENLKHGWVPLFVRNGAGAPSGNARLLERGGVALDPVDLDDASDLARMLQHYEDASRAESGIPPVASDPTPDDNPPVPQNQDATGSAATESKPKKGRKPRRKAETAQLGFSIEERIGEQKTA